MSLALTSFAIACSLPLPPPPPKPKPPVLTAVTVSPSWVIVRKTFVTLAAVFRSSHGQRDVFAVLAVLGLRSGARDLDVLAEP